MIDLNKMSREDLVRLIEQYRELVACAWARSIPHEGTDEADHDWCDYMEENLEYDLENPLVSSSDGKHPAVFRDQAIIDWFHEYPTDKGSKPRAFGWRLLVSGDP